VKGVFICWNSLDHKLLKNRDLSQALWFRPIILATHETEMGRITVQGQPGQKVPETPSQSMDGPGGAPLSSPATPASTNRRPMAQAVPEPKLRHYLKNNQYKKC
jgi:hypothetical protein